MAIAIERREAASIREVAINCTEASSLRAAADSLRTRGSDAEQNAPLGSGSPWTGEIWRVPVPTPYRNAQTWQDAVLRDSVS